MTRFVTLLERTVCSADDRFTDGIKFHVVDIYLDEVEKVAGPEVDLLRQSRMSS